MFWGNSTEKPLTHIHTHTLYTFNIPLLKDYLLLSPPHTYCCWTWGPAGGQGRGSSWVSPRQTWQCKRGARKRRKWSWGAGPAGGTPVVVLVDDAEGGRWMSTGAGC